MGIIMKNDVPYPGAGEPNRELKDNGTSLTDRNAINFTDFDMSDNSTDEETDVKPHRLTSAELDEIVLPVAHEYEGEVIDLRGNEIKVGTVIASDGTKKTLYQKYVDLGNLPNATTVFISTGLPSATTTVMNLYGKVVFADSSCASLPYVSVGTGADASYYIALNTSLVNGEIKLSVRTGRDRTSCTGSAIIQYTKS